jgi:5-methyltetrahydropteroyltriglutamate--homocysteine methyltransferase
LALFEQYQAFAKKNTVDLYFAMAGRSKEGKMFIMTKWFDTNYHYIIPEFTKSKFQFVFRKIIDEYKEAK